MLACRYTLSLRAAAMIPPSCCAPMPVGPRRPIQAPQRSSEPCQRVCLAAPEAISCIVCRSTLPTSTIVIYVEFLLDRLCLITGYDYREAVRSPLFLQWGQAFVKIWLGRKYPTHVVLGKMG